jgi:hypothetical protein
LLLPVVLAAPPFVSSNIGGCQITPVAREVLKINTSFDFNFHVFNYSNGIPLSNTTLDCEFHFYNQTGDHSYTAKLKNDPFSENKVINEWAARMEGGNISTIGTYAYLVQCNGTNTGCADKGYLIVTQSGLNPAGDILVMFIYILFILAALGIFYTFFLTLLKLVTYDETAYDVLLAWAFYILMIIVSYLSGQYLLRSYVYDLSNSILTLTVWTNGVLPLIAFIITFFVKNTQKKKLLSPQEITGFRYGN